MGYQLNHVWKNQKLFKTEGQTKLESSLYYFTWEKELLPEDLLLRKVLFLKVCELLENTFPNLREGDSDGCDKSQLCYVPLNGDKILLPIDISVTRVYSQKCLV